MHAGQLPGGPENPGRVHAAGQGQPNHIAEFFCGTSGFSYESWIGRFYPKRIRAADMLPFYAARLNSVELNTTFYHWPKRSSLQAWAAAAPDGFRFAIKAHRWLANPLNVDRFEAGLPELRELYGRLGSALGPLLFKLPPPAAASTERLGRFLRLVPAGWRVAFEFGHPSWDADDVTRLLEDAGAAACAVDEGRLVPSPRGAYLYVRLRRDRYGRQALAGWAEHFALALARGRDAYVYFKHQAAGPARAERLRALVQTSARPTRGPGV